MGVARRVSCLAGRDGAASGPKPRAAFVGAVLAVLALGGCKGRRAPADLEAPVTPPAPVAPRLPVDRTLPGELAEGTFKAFGLVLPRVMAVGGSYTDVVYGSAEVTSDRIANYVRQRVTAQSIDTGPTKTVFSHAVVRGQPGVELDIHVLSRGGSTDVEIHRIPPPTPAPTGLSDDERWRAAGFRGDGAPLDQTHLE